MMKSMLKTFVLLMGAMLVPTTVFAQGIYGDVNGDCEVNIADVNVIINIILGGDEEPVPEYVDLGLPSGTLWATRNIGANSP